MLLNSKITKLFSEVVDFFTSSEKATITTMKIYQELILHNFACLQSGHHRILNEPHQKLLLLFLFPVFVIKNIPGYLTNNL